MQMKSDSLQFKRWDSRYGWELGYYDIEDEVVWVFRRENKEVHVNAFAKSIGEDFPETIGDLDILFERFLAAVS